MTATGDKATDDTFCESVCTGPEATLNRRVFVSVSFFGSLRKINYACAQRHFCRRLARAASRLHLLGVAYTMKFWAQSELTGATALSCLKADL